jgi:hypothetical protein
MNGSFPSQHGFRNAVQHPQHAMGYSQPAIPALTSEPGIKRTHNQAFDHESQATTQDKPESKAKIPAAPSVPRFGFSLAPATAPANAVPPVSDPASTKKKSRKHNVFGLTPKGDTYEDSDDNVDEEALFAQSGQRYACLITHTSLS